MNIKALVDVIYGYTHMELLSGFIKSFFYKKADESLCAVYKR